MTTTKKKEEEITQPKAVFKGKYFYASGKRKTSVARVRLYNGEGKIIINNKLYGKIWKTRLGSASIDNFQITLQTTFNTRNNYTK